MDAVYPPKITTFGDLKPYTYTPLPTQTSIRLLKLERRHDTDKDEDLHVSIHTRDLVGDASLRYDALSYTWGSPFHEALFHLPRGVSMANADQWANFAFTEPLVIDGDSRLHITPNLAAALKRLRDCPVDLEARSAKCGMTAMHFAAARGQTEIVKALLERGISLDVVDEMGRLPVWYAATGDHLLCLQFMAKNHANLNDLRDILETETDAFSKPIIDYLNEPSSTSNLFSKSITNMERVSVISTDQPVYLWVDAVCINQRDPIECSQQVSIMSRIFSGASIVYSWLGVATASSATAIEFINRVARLRQPPSPTSKIETEESLQEMLDATPLPTIEAVAKLFDRKYWSRQWIIQEMLLSRYLIILVGEHQLEFELLIDTARLLQRRMIDQPVGDLARTYTISLYTESNGIVASRLPNLLDIAAWRDKVYGPGASETIDFATLVNVARLSRCSNPLDKVFAILGLVRPLSEAPVIKIDYTSPIEEVLAVAFQHMIQKLKSLDVLGLVEDEIVRHHRVPSIASRYPTWLGEFDSFSYSQNFSSSQGPISVDWKAAGESKHNGAVADDVTQLPVQGILIDKIVQLATPPAPDEQLMRYNPSWIDIISSLPDKAYPDLSGGTAYTRGEAFYRTLLCNMLDREPLDKKMTIDDQKSQMKWLITYGLCIEAHIGEYMKTGAAPSNKAIWAMPAINDLHRAIEHFVEAEPSSSLIFPTRADIDDLVKDHCTCNSPSSAVSSSCPCMDDIQPYDGPYNSTNLRRASSMNAFFQQIGPYNAGRNLARSAKGYLALVPRSVTVEDEVWLLAGASCPFVLRDAGGRETEGERKKVMGAAFVLNLMEGQGWKNDAARSELESIILV